MLRRVLFVHGYDPRGPGPYHAMMVDEARTGDLEVGPRTGARWTLAADWAGARSESRFEVLRWDDLVRAFWVRGGEARWLSWRYLLAYARAGVVAEAARSNRPLFLALVLPSLVGIVFIGLLVGATAAVIALTAGVLTGLGANPLWALGGGAILLGAPILWRVLRARLEFDWLSQCFDALVRFQDMPEAREAKLDALAETILETAKQPGSEPIVVVGHSIGTLMAVGAVSRALERDPHLGRRLSLVTMGQCLSIYSRLGGDPRWSRDLAGLVASTVPWIDVTSPADGASGGRWGPLRFSGHEARTDRIDARSPRFHQALEPARLKRLRLDPYALHFQYLRLSDRPAVYDVRRLIVGPTNGPS
jgi:hypothetical protein